MRRLEAMLPIQVLDPFYILYSSILIEQLHRLRISQMLSAYFQSLFAFSESATPIKRLSYLATISAMEKNYWGSVGWETDLTY
jgi:hypothetical protein